jgi:hypothetical protein
LGWVVSFLGSCGSSADFLGPLFIYLSPHIYRFHDNHILILLSDN